MFFYRFYDMILVQPFCEEVNELDEVGYLRSAACSSKGVRMILA